MVFMVFWGVGGAEIDGGGQGRRHAEGDDSLDRLWRGVAWRGVAWRGVAWRAAEGWEGGECVGEGRGQVLVGREGGGEWGAWKARRRRIMVQG